MVRLQTEAAASDYNEYNSRLTEQFLHGLDDEGMISETIKEVSVLEHIHDVTSERVPLWTQRVEAQRAQKRSIRQHKRDQWL